MTNDQTCSSQDVGFRQGGTGSLITWRCFGCNKPRTTLGSKGAGVHKRCAACVAAKAVRKEARA